MEILEKRDEWQAHFESNWLKHYQETGEFNWKIYQYGKNESVPSGAALDLSQSKLMFVTTAGAYLKDSQAAYDSENKLGDYSIRTFLQSTALDELAYAHTHYDHKWVDDDPQVLLPLRLLEAMVAEGKIGSLAEKVVAFSGYMPDLSKVLDELVPQIVGMAKEQQVDAVLLVPA
jgi:D-proline reductase (dithiol) PrdB